MRIINTIKNKALSLRIKLVLVILFSFFVSFGVFLGMDALGQSVIESHVVNNERMTAIREDILADLQKYIKTHQLSRGDVGQLKKVVGSNEYVNVTIYDQDKIIFSDNKEVEDSEIYGFLSDEYFSYVGASTVTFSDGVAEVAIDTFYNIKYATYSIYISLFVSISCFFMIVLAAVNKKTRYIMRLKEEMDNIGGGMIDTPISMEGKDELSELASSIDSMRQAVIHQNQLTLEANQLNQKMVAELSHDIRTPLTSLISYLELLDIRQTLSESDKKRYLEISLQKSYQLKEMSNEIFKRFSIPTAHNFAEGELKTVKQIASDEIQQLLRNFIDDLKVQHFVVKAELDESSFDVSINLTDLKRVLDNCLSNIVKYGNHTFPVTIESRVSCQTVQVMIGNQSQKKPHKEVKGTKIGLISSQQNMAKNGGSLSYGKEGEKFWVELSLPLAHGDGE